MTQISGLTFGLLGLLIVGSPAAQTTYPEKPISMVVGFPPGSQADNPRVESDAPRSHARLTRTRYVPFAGDRWLWQDGGNLEA